MRRWLRVWITVLAATVVVGIAVNPLPAYGIPLILDPVGGPNNGATTTINGWVSSACSPTAPDPHRPDGNGLAGWFAPKPNPLPVADNPFTDHKSTIYQQYGVSGMWWPNYDFGCGGSIRQAPSIVWTDVGNIELDIAASMVTFSDQIHQYATDLTPQWIKDIDDAVKNATKGLNPFFTTGMGIGLLAVGLWLTMRAHGANYSEVATHSAWVLGVLALGVMCLSYPTTAGHGFDRASVGLSDEVSGAFNNGSATSDGLAGRINDDALYRFWERGMFGSDSSATAQKYGPALYDSMGYTWAQANALDTDPKQGTKITNSKKDLFQEAAGELHDDDKASYEIAQGKTNAPMRALYGAVACVFIAILSLFSLMASMLVVVARLAGRLFIMGAPVVLPFASMYKWKSPVQRLWRMVQSTFTNLLVFTIAGGAMSLVAGGLLASALPLFVTTGIVLGLTVFVLLATKPAQSLMRQLGRAADIAGPYIAARQGSQVGTKEGVEEALVDHTTSRREAAAEAVSPDEDWSSGWRDKPVVAALSAGPTALRDRFTRDDDYGDSFAGSSPHPFMPAGPSSSPMFVLPASVTSRQEDGTLKALPVGHEEESGGAIALPAGPQRSNRLPVLWEEHVRTGVNGERGYEIFHPSAPPTYYQPHTEDDV